MNSAQRYLIAIDTGGTFTDLAVYDIKTGQTQFSKTLTTASDLVIGAMNGLGDMEIPVSEARVFTHGTTHVINSLLERRGARTALVTTRGFRDVLEIGRGNRAEPFNLQYRRDRVLIPRELRFEIDERISGQGEIVTPIQEEELRSLASALRAANVEAVAISFLNAYRNSSHEDIAAAVLADSLPGVFISTGSSLTRELMEYERTSTVAANAFVGSRMRGYIASFNKTLRDDGFAGQFYLMGSNGGVMSAKSATERPVSLVESGPVGGCIGAVAYARALGLDRVIAFDMGGTTAKCALIENASFDVVNTYFVNGYERGFPIRTPVLDIVEIGAGGGSLAWIDDNGRMQLGPHSAGSEPGPIAFGRGGTQPTVTDANVVLGRLGSRSFMGGKLPLNTAAAMDGVKRILAEPLGLPGDSGIARAAQGILDLACVAMTTAIKEVTIERGRDVREYSLFAFGGGGPIFAAELAKNLGIREIIIPPEPGAFSSFGMLLAPLRRDVATTFLREVTADSLHSANDIFEQLERQARQELAEETDITKLRVRREADMSYREQGYTVKVSLPADATPTAVREAFEQAYRGRYGHLNKESPVCLAMLRIVCEVPMEGPDLKQFTSGTRLEARPIDHRDVQFSMAERKVRTPIYRRGDLGAGCRVDGPAIIEEFTSTTLVAKGDWLQVGELGELRIHCSGK